MLTAKQISDNKIKYLELLSKLNIDLTNFTKYLTSERVDFFNKPFNNYQDSAFPGSLCAHSLSVYSELIKLAELYYPGVYNEEDIIKVALLKDLYRAELYEAYNKNVKNETTGQWETQLAYRTKEIRPIFGDINFSSYMIAKKFFDLSNDEVVEAICNSSIGNNNIEIHNIRKDYKLVTLTTLAEIASSYLGD